MPRLRASVSMWNRSALPPPDLGLKNNTARSGAPTAGRSASTRNAKRASTSAIARAATTTTSSSTCPEESKARIPAAQRTTARPRPTHRAHPPRSTPYHAAPTPNERHGQRDQTARKRLHRDDDREHERASHQNQRPKRSKTIPTRPRISDITHDVDPTSRKFVDLRLDLMKQSKFSDVRNMGIRSGFRSPR